MIPASGNVLLAGGDDSYNITRSLRLRSSASAYLSRTPASSSSQSRYTLSFWVKRGTLGTAQTLLSCVAYGNSSYQTYFRFNSSDQLEFYNSWGSDLQNLVTTQVFRDPSAWYHITIAVNMNAATRPDAVQISVNGNLVTAYSTTTWTNVYQATAINSAYAHNLGRDVNTSGSYSDEYLADFYFIDGQQLLPTSFGSFDTVTGVWKPKKYLGTYGSLGYYLQFSQSSATSYAASFNGSSQSVNTPSNSTFNFGSGNFTVETWINTTQTTQYATVISKTPGAFSGGMWSMLLNNTGAGGQSIAVYAGDYSAGAPLLDTTGVNVTDGSWHHVAWVRNGSTHTLYVDGIARATATSAVTISNLTGSVYLGQDQTYSRYFNGRLSNTRIVVGTAVYTSNFVPSTTPLTAISGTQLLTFQNTTVIDNSSNAFSLTNTGSVATSVVSPFVTNSNITADRSGNNNNWTPNNISLTPGSTYDSMTDVPTLTSETAANFATANPLRFGSYITLSNGNLTVTGNTSTDSALTFSTIGKLTSGKWYWEYTQGTAQSETCGVITQNVDGLSVLNGEAFTASYGVGARANGAVYGTEKTTSTVTSWASGDVIGIALDCDNGAIYWSKNGTWLNSGVPTSGSSKTGAVGVWTPSSTKFITPSFGAYNGGSVSITFGQRPFSYTPPTGFKALNAYNLPDPTIKAGNKYMDATLYTGNGTTTGNTQTVTNAGGFKPDLVWIKSRSAAQWHVLTDSVRGANKTLYSNDTYQEESLSNVMNSFNSNGFTAAYNSAYSSVITNANGATYVGWQWQAGQGTTSSNTSGSITSTVSVNASAGFSVVTYTGTGAAATVGHGLGVAPQLIIGRSRTNSGFNWGVWHISLQTLYGNNAWLRLNTTDSYNTSFDVFDPQNNTSSVFGIGSEATMNASGSNFVAYCWTPIAGYSAFGSYTGNGSTDGTFVYMGFRPKYVLVKRTDTTGDWILYDTSRSPYNLTNLALFPNGSYAEATATVSVMDIVSNGFKCRGSGTELNASGGTYIYACFAENPFKYSLAR